MVEPRVIPRAEHPISRREIDPDALKVLYRLHQGSHIAYLVGGSVRDLLLGRRPKDFDIGTSAHPGQIKKLFRNCWIIGRRFRLAHVKFGTKVIEVATFRRLVPAVGDVPDTAEVPEVAAPASVVPPAVAASAPRDDRPPHDLHLIHRDNTFGTPEEDAFRRDFTINALFYDIATFGIIDYVNGMDDLRAGVVRSIGDPEVRFQEDPVRMLRAVALAARLDFVIDPPILEAIGLHRHEMAKSSPARLLEEYYKILRSGHAEKTFRALASTGLLEPISAELHQGANDPLWRSLAAVDAYRSRFATSPDTLTNAVLLGSLLAPLGFTPQLGRHSDAIPRLGALPLARRDVERLRQVLGLQRRLHDLGAHARAKRALTHVTFSPTRWPGSISTATGRSSSPTGRPSWPSGATNRPPLRRPKANRHQFAGVADAAGGTTTPHPTDSQERLFRVFVFSWPLCSRDFFDGLVRLGEAKRDEQLDDGPRGVDLARAEAELRAAGVAVMVVVQTFAARQQRDRAEVGGGIVEVLVAEDMAEPVDR
jgi:poly(A) polymerase